CFFIFVPFGYLFPGCGQTLRNRKSAREAEVWRIPFPNRRKIAISTRPAERRRPNNTALATVSLSRSTIEPDVTPRPGATHRAPAFLDKIVSSVHWWRDRLPSTGLRQYAGRRRT